MKSFVHKIIVILTFFCVGFYIINQHNANVCLQEQEKIGQKEEGNPHDTSSQTVIKEHHIESTVPASHISLQQTLYLIGKISSFVEQPTYSIRTAFFAFSLSYFQNIFKNIIVVNAP